MTATNISLNDVIKIIQQGNPADLVGRLQNTFSAGIRLMPWVHLTEDTHYEMGQEAGHYTITLIFVLDQEMSLQVLISPVSTTLILRNFIGNLTLRKYPVSAEISDISAGISILLGLFNVLRAGRTGRGLLRKCLCKQDWLISCAYANYTTAVPAGSELYLSPKGHTFFVYTNVEFNHTKINSVWVHPLLPEIEKARRMGILDFGKHSTKLLDWKDIP